MLEEDSDLRKELKVSKKQKSLEKVAQVYLSQQCANVRSLYVYTLLHVQYHMCMFSVHTNINFVKFVSAYIVYVYMYVSAYVKYLGFCP